MYYDRQREKEERMQKIWKKVEAMYYKGYSATDISEQLRIRKDEAIEIMQTIFARNEMKREREERYARRS